MTEWVRDLDGEYNEASLTLPNGVTVTVFSDREEGQWSARIDDGEMFDLAAGSRDEARAEALRIARA